MGLLSRLMGSAPAKKAKFGGLKDSIKALGDSESPAVKKKCFVLAADIAMASGDIDEAEDTLLETMRLLLGIDDAFASRVIEVLQTKYTV